MRLVVQFTGKHRFSVALVILLLLAVATGVGCSNEPANDSSVKGMKTPEAKPFSPVGGYVPAFYLERKAFLAVDDTITRYKDKLVLQFQAKEKANDFSLAVFTIADEEKKQEDVSKAADKERIVHPVPFANALKLSDTAIKLSNQRTREDEYQKLLKEVKKYRFINYVIFLPEVEGDHVRFRISGVEKLPLDLMATGFATASYLSRSF